jgi:CelD/BcsL family acetyltransferase involved in cellulose biosynthesis
MSQIMSPTLVEPKHLPVLLETGPFRVVQAKSLDDLSPFAEAWNDLALQMPQRLPMLSHAWVTSFLEHQLQPNESWFALLALQEEVLVGVLPLVVSPHRVPGIHRPRLHTPGNEHTRSVDLVVALGSEAFVTRLLLSAVLRAQPEYFDLELSAIPEMSPTVLTLGVVAEQAFVRTLPSGRGSVLKTTGSFEGFHDRLSQNFKKNHQKSRKKLARLSGVQLRFLTGSQATPEELERFLKVEGSGWKGRAGTAIEQSPKLASFYTAVVQRLSRLGWLEWTFLEAEGRTISGQLAVRMGGALTILKIGYDESYRSCSPGNLLFEETARRAFASPDIVEINCLTDMAWHDKWGMEKKGYLDIQIYPRRPLSLLFGYLPKQARLGVSRLPGIRPLYRAGRMFLKEILRNKQGGEVIRRVP